MFLKIYKKLFLLILFFLSSCQTTSGVIISETMLPIKLSRSAIRAALGEPRLMSQNGREFTTYYHDRKLKYLDVTAKTQERLYTKVTILGARRPFDISVEVRVEQRDPDSKIFQDIGLDEGLSTTQAKAVRQALNQSRDKIQAIDEGAPF